MHSKATITANHTGGTNSF